MARKAEYHLEEWRRLGALCLYDADLLAKRLRVSRRTLERTMREALGSSPQDWLKMERINASPDLLLKLRCAKVVAFRLGFKQLSQFSRDFKRRHGLSPRAFLARADRQTLVAD